MFDQISTGLTGTGHDVDHTIGKFTFSKDLGQTKCRQRGGLRWLEHHGVPACDRGCDLPGGHHQREVPGNHLGTDSQRPGIDVSGNRVRQLVAPPGVVEEVLRDQWDVHVTTFLDRLSTIHGLQDGEFPGPLLNPSGDSIEELAPLDRLRP